MTKLRRAAAALVVTLAAAITAASAQDAPRTFTCDSGETVEFAVTSSGARITYKGQSFDMFRVAGTAERFSTEAGLSPDHGLQWLVDGSAGTLSEMVMDHTAGAPTVIETCRVTGPVTTAPAADRVVVEGHAFFLERILVPGDPVLTVELLDRNSGKVVGRASMPAPGSDFRFRFSLAHKSEPAKADYALTASLSSEGEVWFHTPEPVAIGTPGGAPLEIRLIRAGAPAQQSNSPYGTWRASEINGQPTNPRVESRIVLSEDGHVSGTGGCNPVGGGFEVDGTAITFSHLFSGMMACMGPEGEQESAFLQALDNVRSFTVAGDTLVLSDAGGNPIIRLVPAR